MNKQYKRPNPMRVAVYARFGNDPQAPPQNGEPIRYYSGKQPLLTASRASQIDHLIVEGFTSLGRNSVESLGLLHELRAAGVRVSLLREGRVV